MKIGGKKDLLRIMSVSSGEKLEQTRAARWLAFKNWTEYKAFRSSMVGSVQVERRKFSDCGFETISTASCMNRTKFKTLFQGASLPLHVL